MAFLLGHGTKFTQDVKANIPSSLPIGNFFYATDTDELFAGTGLSLFQIAGSSLALNDLRVNSFEILGNGDLRGRWTTGVEDGLTNGIFEFYQEIGTVPTSVYLLGTDFNLKHRGPADFYWTASKLACTTTASLIIGANTNVLVSGLTETLAGIAGNTNLFAQTSGQALVIGRNTVSAETLTWNASGGTGTWYVVDGTHLYLNCANTHSGTTDIEQGPGIVFAIEQSIVVQANKIKPSQATFNPPLWFMDNVVGGKLLGLPSDLSTSAPFNGVIFGAQVPVYYITDPSYYTPYPPANWIKAVPLISAVNNIPAETFTLSDEGGNISGIWANPVIVATATDHAPTTGQIRLNSGNAITWRNNANSGDLGLGSNSSDLLDITTGFLGLKVSSGSAINWNGDTGISRISANVIGFGNGTPGDISGFFKAAGLRVAPDATHVADLGFAAFNVFGIGSTMTLGWYSTPAGFTPDTGISRTVAGVLAIGNGSGGDTSGALYAALVSPYSVALTGQTSSIAATNLVASPTTTSLYEIRYYLNDTTAGTSGTVSVTISWNDGAAQSVTSANVTFGVLGAYVSGVIVVKATSGAIQYATTITSPIGSPQYSLDLRVTELR